MNFKNHFEQKNQTNQTQKIKIIKQNIVQQVNTQENNYKKNIQHQRNLTPNLVQNLNYKNYQQQNKQIDQNIQGQNQSAFIQNYQYDNYQQPCSFQQQENQSKNQKIKIIEIKSSNCSSKFTNPERSLSQIPQTRPSINRLNIQNFPQEANKFTPHIEYKQQIQYQNQQYPYQQDQQVLMDSNYQQKYIYSNNNQQNYTEQNNKNFKQYSAQNEISYNKSDYQNYQFNKNKYYQNSNQYEDQNNNQSQNNQLFDEKYHNNMCNRYQDPQLNFEQTSNSQYHQFNNYQQSTNQNYLQNLQECQIQTQNNSQKNNITIVNHDSQKEQQSPEQNDKIDMYESLCRSIVFKCERCQMAIESNSAQLACYHSYHHTCLEEHIIQQIKSKKQLIKCQCGIKISEATIKYQLNLSNSSSILQEFHNNQLFSLLEKNKQFYNFQVCQTCNFFWIQSSRFKPCICRQH